MTTPDCERWIAISDQASLGEILSEKDQAWLLEHARGCAECAAEMEFYASLREGLGRPEALLLPAQVAPRRRAPRRRLWGLGLALAAGAALAMGIGATLRHRAAPPIAVSPTPPISAQVLFASGEARVGARAASAGLSVGQGEVFSTGDGLACLAIAQSITVCLDARGSASLSMADPRHIVVYLDKGRLLARLDHQPVGRKFLVRTTHTEVQAVGTRFLVGVQGDGRTLVRLHEGRIAIRAANTITSEIAAPAQANVGDDIRLAPFPETAAAEDRTLLRLSALPRSGTGLPLHVQSDPPGAEVLLGDQPMGKTPVTTFLPGDTRLQLSLPGFVPLTEWIKATGDAPMDRLFTLHRIPPAGAAAPPVHHRVDAKVSPGQLLAKAQALRARGDYRACAALYRRLWAVFPTSGEALVSLVSLGELELTEGKNPAAALRAFGTYLSVGGPLAREARFGKIRALRRLARDQEADRETATFLRDYPVSIQAATLRRQPHAR